MRILKIYSTKLIKHQLGFNLIEVMVVMVIIAILATLSLPTLNKQFEDIEARQVRNTIQSILRQAKVSSFTYRQHVVVCLADENNICHREAQQHIIAFFDANDNHLFDPDDDTIIQNYALSLKYGRVYLRMGARRHYIKFFADSGTPRGFMGHIKYCPNDDTNLNRYQISFSMSGRVQYKPDDFHPTGCP